MNDAFHPEVDTRPESGAHVSLSLSLSQLDFFAESFVSRNLPKISPAAVFSFPSRFLARMIERQDRAAEAMREISDALRMLTEEMNR